MKRAHILLVEDNPADILLTREAFKSSRLNNRLEVAEDGEIALEVLHKAAAAGESALPDLILLDLNLPKIDGLEVLRTIKDDPMLRRIPTIVLTSSAADRDVLGSYDRHANGVIVKPVDFPQLQKTVFQLESFWFCIVRLPTEDDPALITKSPLRD